MNKIKQDVNRCNINAIKEVTIVCNIDVKKLKRMLLTASHYFLSKYMDLKKLVGMLLAF